jgi:UTP--glucose-1-phosphate uridylyltransferase
MIGDHVYVSNLAHGCAQQVVETAAQHDCSVSGVQATRENLLPYFGVIGGQRLRGSEQLYSIERVTEKPTPTLAEQTLLVPGLRAGHYLGLFGIHVLSASVMALLEKQIASATDTASIQLSPVLNELAQHERYLALEVSGKRYPLDSKYGLLRAQLALGMDGEDREEVLAMLCELLAQRESGLGGR